jgi:hypothetical protein
MVSMESPSNNRQRNVIIAVVVAVLLLCCCCIAFVLSAYFVWGDAFVNAIQPTSRLLLGGGFM